jgi:hypothetical protein
MSYGRVVRGPPPSQQGGGGGAGHGAGQPGGPPANLLVEVYRLQLAIWNKMKNLDVRLQRIEKYLDVAPSQFGKKVNIDGKGVDILSRNPPQG